VFVVAMTASKAGSLSRTPNPKPIGVAPCTCGEMPGYMGDPSGVSRHGASRCVWLPGQVGPHPHSVGRVRGGIAASHGAQITRIRPPCQ